MDRRTQIREIITGYFQSHPKLQIQDMFKFLYQSSFGCEHLLSDSEGVVRFLQEEFSSCGEFDGDLVENLDGEYCRVHLEYMRKGLSAETFGKIFCLSAEPVQNGKQLLEEKLSVLMELVKEGILPFAETKIQEAIERWYHEGYPPCRHSEEYRNTYHPAYRVIKKEYALFLPLFCKIDCLLQHGKVTFAIEGGSASGKTTLSNLLKRIYDCNIFHMDDFFLRPQQRTKERFEEVGGNVDRERFFEEVLVPLSKNETIYYTRFDCGTFTLLPAKEIEPKLLNVIEGSYSMHPKLAKMYDFGVFLDIDPKLQKERILKRNSQEFAKRFLEEWIPMEKRYHEIMKVKERCTLSVSII